MTAWLHFHFSLSCIGEGNGNPLQCSCLENPKDRGAWWAAVSGVAQSQTRLKRLSSSSSSSSKIFNTRKQRLTYLLERLGEQRSGKVLAEFSACSTNAGDKSSPRNLCESQDPLGSSHQYNIFLTPSQWKSQLLITLAYLFALSCDTHSIVSEFK